MCEILINLRTRSDDKDWTPGMAAVVFEDGHVWGREESKQVWIAEGRPAAEWPGQGKFAILKLPGVPAAKGVGIGCGADRG